MCSCIFCVRVSCGGDDVFTSIHACQMTRELCRAGVAVSHRVFLCGAAAGASLFANDNNLHLTLLCVCAIRHVRMRRKKQNPRLNF